ncbi:MAG: hypothetical protein HRT61_03315 [Ekhidna sp.]|nr:hypothetical protein [Ekhidna sp.]
MKENKITTYLLYAFGEILLVVVGILIALSIDNWNQNRQKKQLEIEYLQEIKTSLEEDIANGNDLVAFNQQRMSFLDTVLTKMQNRNVEEMKATLIYYVQPTFDYRIFKMNRIGIDNMVASESIALISNSVLRNALSKYYSEEVQWQERVANLSGTYIDMIMPRVMSQQVFARGGYDFPINQSKYLQLYEDPEVLNVVYGLKTITQTQSGRVGIKIENARQLVEEINKELEVN